MHSPTASEKQRQDSPSLSFSLSRRIDRICEMLCLPRAGSGLCRKYVNTTARGRGDGGGRQGSVSPGKRRRGSERLRARRGGNTAGPNSWRFRLIIIVILLLFLSILFLFLSFSSSSSSFNVGSFSSMFFFTNTLAR